MNAVKAQYASNGNQNDRKDETHPKDPTDGSSRFPLFPPLIATSLGFGFLPVAPGTWGALFAILAWLPLYLLGIGLRDHRRPQRSP